MPVIYDNAKLVHGADVIMYITHSTAVTVFASSVSYLPPVYMRPFLASYYEYDEYRYFADYTYTSKYADGMITMVPICHYYFLTDADADIFDASMLKNDIVNYTRTVVNTIGYPEDKSVDYRPIVTFHWAVLN
jgi:hypothetical protein